MLLIFAHEQKQGEALIKCAPRFNQRFLKSGESTISLVNGTSRKIEVEVIPNTALNKELVFSIDNEIATITNKGEITAKQVGEATLTIKSVGNVNITKTVRLYKPKR